MRKLLILLTLVLLASCGGGGRVLLATLPTGQPEPATGAPAALTLALTAETTDDNQRVVLVAKDAVDLYQLAATLEFDASRYQLVDTAAGGGLGDPAHSYFICEETSPGRLDFAYTRRFYGPGASGDVRLLEILVSPSDSFSLSDFSLSGQPEAQLARDSAKRELAIIGPGVQP